MTSASATESQDDVPQTPPPLSKITTPSTSTHLEIYHNERYEYDRLDIGLYIGRDLSNEQMKLNILCQKMRGLPLNLSLIHI